MGRKRSEECKINWDNKYSINWSFFSSMSHNLAYFLGYLAGDGGAYSDGKTVDVSSSDPEIIYKFRDLIAPNNTVSKQYYKRGGIVNAGIMYDFKTGKIEVWSIVNSYDVKSPSIFSRIPVPFLPSFIRGFLDSDGCITESKGKTCLGVQVLFYQNNTLYLEALSSVLVSWGLSPAPITVDRGNHRLRLRLEDSLLLLDRLYAHKGDLYLRRKYDIYLKVVESRGGHSIAEIYSNASKFGYNNRSMSVV